MDVLNGLMTLPIFRNPLTAWAERRKRHGSAADRALVGSLYLSPSQPVRKVA